MEKYIGKKLVVINGVAAEAIFSTKTSSVTKFIIDSDYGAISMSVIGGHDPFIEEVYAGIFEVIGSDVDEYERKSNFRFCHRTGMSGAMDLFIEYLTKDYGFPKRKFILHESMMDKVSQIEEGTFLYDVLDLGRALGWVCIEDGKYKPSDKLKTKIEEEKMNIKLVSPRVIDKEDGWGEYELVDIHNIVRKDDADDFDTALAEAFAEEDGNQ